MNDTLLLKSGLRMPSTFVEVKNAEVEYLAASWGWSWGGFFQFIGGIGCIVCGVICCATGGGAPAGVGLICSGVGLIGSGISAFECA